MDPVVIEEHCLFHGTSVESALYFLNGGELDLEMAQHEHVEGAVGFYLTTDPEDAEYFAQMRNGTVIEFDLSERARFGLLGPGVVRPIPRNALGLPAFRGSELFVPPDAFPAFNDLRGSGEIRVRPYSPSR